MTSFTNIQQALQFKSHCPFCEQLLQREVRSCYSSDSVEIVQTSWLHDRICFKIIADLNDEKINLSVYIDINSNRFDYELIGNKDTTNIGELLNLSHITISVECIPCKYILEFHALKFDMSLKRIHKISFGSEQCHVDNYKLYSDSDSTFIYHMTDEGYRLVTMAPRYQLTKESAPTTASWLKTIIIFS